jgi:hypothetical protein
MCVLDRVSRSGLHEATGISALLGQWFGRFDKERIVGLGKKAWLGLAGIKSYM